MAAVPQEAARTLRQLKHTAGDSLRQELSATDVRRASLCDGHEVGVFEMGGCCLEGGVKSHQNRDIVSAIVPDHKYGDPDDFQPVREGQVRPALPHIYLHIKCQYLRLMWLRRERLADGTKESTGSI